MRIAVVATAVCFSILGLATADDASAAIRRPTHIAPQPLGAALKELAQSRGLQVLFLSETVRDVRTGGAAGSLTTDEAFGQLLSGTGLTYRYLDDKTVTILPASSVGSGGPSTHAEEQGSGGTNVPNSEESKGFWNRFRVAQVDQGQTSSAPTVETRDEQAAKKKPVVLEEVIVTGSRIPQPKEAAQDVRIYTRQEIEQSGQSTVADFFNTLSNVSVASSEGFTNGQQTFAGASTVQLHGLPVGTTLILINGRSIETNGLQAQSFSAGFFDLNSVPLAAVERVEVVPQGSSAIYGSDALGGVINIVLRKDFDGVEANTKYGFDTGENQLDASLASGKQWDKGSFSVLASFQTRGRLSSSDRFLTANTDYRSFGGIDARLDACSPSNVYFPNGFSFNGQSPVSYAAVPVGSTGTPTLAEFASTAGQLNKCSGYGDSAVVPRTQRLGVLASGRRELTSSAEVFTELMYSHALEDTDQGTTYLFGEPGFQSFSVPASNPYNPFGQVVGISTAIPSVPHQGLSTDTDFFRGLIGSKGSLFNDWKWEVAAWIAQDRSHYVQSLLNSAAIQSALNVTDPATALNPFIASRLGPQQLLESFTQFSRQTQMGRTEAANGFVRGPVFPLPAGPLSVVFGSEYDRDSVSYDFISNPGFPPNSRATFRRTSYAIFGEARIPILGNHSNPQAGDVLAATAAERYDRYSDFGSKTTPQFGVELRPVASLLLRGTYSRAFKAPPLFDLYFLQGLSTPAPVVDPKRGGEVETVIETTGGNPNLHAETGQSRTFGFVYSSQLVPNLDVAVTRWSIDVDGAIQTLGAQVLVENESLFPGAVIRAPSCPGGAPCPIISVSSTPKNFGRIDVAGIDLRINYSFDTPFGRLSPSAIATETTSYTTALIPGSAATDRNSIANDDGNWAPRWKGTLALGWQHGGYTANVDGRYVGRYQDYDRANEIGNFWLVDTNVRYPIGRVFASNSSMLKDTYAEIGGTNIFNKSPQYSNYVFGFLGFDPAQWDIRGRFLYANLRVKW